MKRNIKIGSEECWLCFVCCRVYGRGQVVSPRDLLEKAFRFPRDLVADSLAPKWTREVSSNFRTMGEGMKILSDHVSNLRSL